MSPDVVIPEAVFAVIVTVPAASAVVIPVPPVIVKVPPCTIVLPPLSASISKRFPPLTKQVEQDISPRAESEIGLLAETANVPGAFGRV